MIGQLIELALFFNWVMHSLCGWRVQTAPFREAVLFIDSSMAGAVEQVEIFFRSGFFSAQHACLLIRWRKGTAPGYRRLAKRYGIEIHWIRTRRSAQLPVDGVVYYPFNGDDNVWIMKSSRAVHVFLSHGESNKRASIEPMLGCYDYVLVAGQLAVDRLCRYRRLRMYDDGHNAIMIGDSLTGTIFSSQASEDNCALLYMPTWEGGSESVNYSSLMYVDLANLIFEMAKINKVTRVLFSAHPNTGQRLRRYRLRLSELAREVRAHGLSFIEICSSVLVSGGHGYCIRHAVVDISAAEAMAASGRIPSTVLMWPAARLYAADSYVSLRRNALFRLGIDKISDFIAKKSTSDIVGEEEIKFRRSLIEYTAPLNEAMQPGERLEQIQRLIVMRSIKNIRPPVDPFSGD